MNMWFDLIYWLIWFCTCLSSGLVSGMMLGHRLLLGKFFNWFFVSRNQTLHSQTYVVFAKEQRPEVLFNGFVAFSVALNILFVILSKIQLHGFYFALASTLSVLMFVAVYFGSGYGKTEVAVIRHGDHAPELVNRYLKWNLRAHTVFTFLWVISASSRVVLPIFI